MTKYILPAAVASVFILYTGCDSQCCESTEAETVVNSAPVIADVLGVPNNSVKECTPGETLDLTTSATDPDANLDENTYVWMVDGQVVTNGTVDCPADNESKQVCVTVKDEEGLQSNQVCITLQGKEEPVACPALEISAVDDNNASYTVDGVTASSIANNRNLIAGHTYVFSHTRTDCPMTCTWNTFQSTQVDGNFTNPFDCIANGRVVDNAGHVVVDNNDTTSPTVTVHTCDVINDDGTSKYEELKVEVKCDDGSSAIRYFNITAP